MEDYSDNQQKKPEELMFNEQSREQAVMFTFDIEDLQQGELSEHSNSYETSTGHEVDMYEVFSGDGVHLMHGKVNSHNRGNICINNKSAYVYFIFCIHGSRNISWEDKSEGVQVDDLKQQVFLLQENTDLHIQWAPAEEVEFFEISIKVDYLKEVLPKQHMLYYALNEKVEADKTGSLLPYSLPVWPQVKTLLHEAVYSKLTGISKAMHIKAKIIEMLALQQSKYENIHKDVIIDEVVSDQDRERMMQVKRIVLKDINASYSLYKLAQMVGTNECYLKNNFKKVFGTTVYGYIKQLKMEKARKLLKSKGKNIAEIAHIVGYKHPAHFTTAFKKHFGFTPNKVSSFSFGLLISECEPLLFCVL